MNETNNGVEETVETATVQQEVVTETATEVDYEAILAEKDAQLAKVQQEKDNYRKGLLKAKGKIPEDYQSDTDEPETMETIIDRKVQEKFLSTKEAQLQAEKDQALRAVLKRNKELETALKNRGQITSTSGDGSNQEKPEGKKDNYFSNEQIAYFKNKGWSNEKIEDAKKNMHKVSQMPK
jgi:hypothetical protein